MPVPCLEVHLLADEAGCRWARDQKAVAVVVDALRASATLTMLVHRGASEVIVVQEVDEARAYCRAHPGTLLAGERGGLKVDGFDLGNSPIEVQRADIQGKGVAFTSTTGAQRLVACLGASSILVGTTINATASAHQAAALAQAANVPIVIIPAGLATHPGSVAEEDWLGAVVVAAKVCEASIHRDSEEPFQHYQRLIHSPGLVQGFLTSAHGQKLLHLGFADDIRLCAQVDLITDTVPVLDEVVLLPQGGRGIRLRPAHGPTGS